MGCLFSKGEAQKEEEEAPKVYSWDRKDKPDRKDFILENLNGETVGRVPGTVNGQQFIIKNCQNCSIYIFDHSATITVDKCLDCKIFLGPIKGSVFLRNCTSCQCVVACQQFRSRDCKAIDAFLHCGSQPIIETSSKMRFGCFQYHYPELADQFDQSKLSPYRSTWDTVHDFSPMPDERNWTLLPEDSKVEDFLPTPATEQFQNLKISTATDDSVVPLTTGNAKVKGPESSLVAFVKDPSSDERLRQFLKDMRQEGSCDLAKTSELEIDADLAARLFGEDSKFASAATDGVAVGLEFNGTDTAQVCQRVAQPLLADLAVFLPADSGAGARALETWNNAVESQMAM